MDVFSFRLKIIYGVVCLLALLFLGKLFFIQILNGASFKERAEGQYTAPVANIFKRGSIYFQTKDRAVLSAATLKTGYTIAINPSRLADPEALYEGIVKIIPEFDEESFFFKAGKKDDPYEEILTKIRKEDASSIKNLGMQGVSMYEEKWRYYPGETLAAHVLGFVGFQGDEYRGQYGVERYYNDVLVRNDRALYVNFFAEVFANIEQSLFYERAREGDLVLTIEPEVERYAEGVLESFVNEWDARSGGIIIINPRDGSLYAMAARPTFNPNAYQNEREYGIFSNPLVENVYEMGSIIKPLTMAAGLDAGVVTPESTYMDNGFVEVDGYTIRNFDGEGRGMVSMQEVLNQSLNTGAMHIMKKLGNEKFSDYFLRYGLGEETGIDLPNEVPGLVENLKSSRDVEHATASFGQGIAMTPIATVRALSVLANSGVIVTPHVVEKIDYTLIPSKTISFGGEKRILKEETAEEITRMLVRVVDEALLGGSVKLPHHSIAAKTGTAQIADKEKGGYYDDRFLHSFFGYFPAYDPRFLVFLYLEEPEGVRYASQTLTEPFMDIAKFLIQYYEIPPDR